MSGVISTVPSYFRDNNALLSLSLHTKLRTAQIAATWALAARALAGESVSQAILPTGTGKTAVLTALPLAICSRRVLVIVPSTIIRRQTANEFRTLKTLKTSRAVPADIPLPKVRTIRSGTRSIDDWEELENYDVIISTPQCISSAYKGIVPPPKGFFDLLLIDEAHHAAARTWNQVIDDHRDVPAALLTATPFRRDKKRLPGEISYVYTLAHAIRDKVYSPIEFVAVTPVSGEDRDLTLAKAAKERLAMPPHADGNSQLLVRTDRLDDAARLREVYRSIGIKIPVLSSRLTDNEVDAIVRDLNAGSIRGVIVVGVLTEGFDLPTLKIAVYHKKHKSFASTLQFVGRLARRVDGTNAQPELLAFASDLTNETAELYREDASWPEMLPKIADAAVAGEREARAYLASFNNIPEAFSIITVEPRPRAQIFELDGAHPDLSIRFLHLLESPIIEFFSDEDRKLAAFVTRDIVHPDWLRSTALDTPAFDLHMVCVDSRGQYLFVQTNSAATTAEILSKYELGDLRKVGPEKMNAALHTYPISDYSMVGLRNRSPNAATGFSYKTVSGHSAAQGVTHADHTNTSAGHLSARFLKGRFTTTVGSSLDSGKMWETNRRSLYDFREWCEDVAGRLNTQPKSSAPPALGVPIRESLKVYPKAPVLAVVIDQRMFDAVVDPDGRALTFFDCRLLSRAIGDYAIVGLAGGRTLLATCCIGISGIATPGSKAQAIELGGEKRSLADWLNHYPPIIFFADGTSTYNGTISSVPQRLATIGNSGLQEWDWGGVDIRHESLPPRPGYSENIQSATIARILPSFPDAFIIVDDGANEIADIIVIRPEPGRTVRVDLYHCKWSSDDKPGHRLNDLTEVLAQVSRSVRWAFPSTLASRIAYRIDERPERLWQGNKAALKTLLTSIGSGESILSFTQYAVQPGLRIAGMLNWAPGAALATVTANWCREFDMDLVICGT